MKSGRESMAGDEGGGGVGVGMGGPDKKGRWDNGMKERGSARKVGKYGQTGRRKGFD